MSWEKVFDAYPDTEQIYVVNGMPFINKRHADSHAVSTKKPVETVKRPAKLNTKEVDPAEVSAEGGEETVAKTAKKGAKKA